MAENENSNLPLPNSQITVGAKFDATTIKWQLNAEEIIQDIQHELLGEQFDIEQRKWIKIKDETGKIISEPMINKKGMRIIYILLKTRLNKITFLTKLKEETILNMVSEIEYDLRDQFTLKWQEWDIKKEHLSMIVKMVGDTCYCGLMKSEGAGERESISQTIARREVYGSLPQGQDKNGFWGSIFNKRV